MKIGIITYHRACNYGAVLQCYALQNVLRKICTKQDEILVVDYRQKNIENQYAPFKLKFFVFLLKRLGGIRYLFQILKRRKKYKRFQKFVKQRLHLTSPYYDTNFEKFDYIIIGSDQVWKKMEDELDSAYSGEGIKNKSDINLIGYAISSNISSIDEFGKDKICSYVSNFDALSFREFSILKKIESMTSKQFIQVLDPTLLLGESFWNNITNNKYVNKSYILLYEVRKSKNNPSILHEKAIQLAEQLNCSVLDFSDSSLFVEDFVTAIKYAKYVITSSFHATAFSIIFHKPLYAVKLNDGHDERYQNLLEQLNAQQLLVNCDFEPVPQMVNYELIDQNLEILRKKSEKFIIESLSL